MIFRTHPHLAFIYTPIYEIYSLFIKKMISGIMYYAN